jgi:hypothetical protein
MDAIIFSGGATGAPITVEHGNGLSDRPQAAKFRKKISFFQQSGEQPRIFPMNLQNKRARSNFARSLDFV